MKDDNDALFVCNDGPIKGVNTFFQLEPLSEVLEITNPRHTKSRISTRTKLDFRLKTSLRQKLLDKPARRISSGMVK